MATIEPAGEREHLEKLLRGALLCGTLGLLAWLLTYSWVLLALVEYVSGQYPDFLDALVMPSIALGKVVSLVSGVLGAALGVEGIRDSRPGTAERRMASRRSMLNLAVLVLLFVPDLVFVSHGL